MNRIILTALFFMCFALSGLAQIIENVQFKDMAGKEYDLYQVLGTGKHVYVEMIFNT